jgi:hypothetical protein
MYYQKEKHNCDSVHCTAFLVFITINSSTGYVRNALSVQVGKIKGIKIRLHFTLLIGFLLISWSAATVFTQHHYHGFTATGYWIVGAITALKRIFRENKSRIFVYEDIETIPLRRTR